MKEHSIFKGVISLVLNHFHSQENYTGKDKIYLSTEPLTASGHRSLRETKVLLKNTGPE